MRPNSLLTKLATCFIAGITFAALLLLLGNSGTSWWFAPAAVFSLVGLSLIMAFVFPFVWHYKENRQKANTRKVSAILYAFIRYCIAFNLSSFGWKKVLGLQFVVPFDIASKPMNQQSGEWLTWFYFGHSPTFGLIIAAIQIIGSYLLLFRRTMLLAEVILFSFMLNLTLINIFYGMNAGALLQSLAVTVGLLFLLVLEHKRLTEFFLNAQSHLPQVESIKPSTKSIVRLSAIVLSLLFTIYLKLWLNTQIQ
jgi:hypothetical protein